MTTARAARAAALLLTGTPLICGGLLTTPAWAAAGDLQLDPGASGGALFSAAALAPGHPVTRCVAVTESDGGGTTADVRLFARVSGALAPGLLLRVELGSGGSYDDCSGFVGSTAFTGTLAGFGLQHADFATGLVQTAAVATYRFTVELADDQQWQGLSAATQFVWQAQRADAPAVVPSPSPAPSPTPSATPAPLPSAAAPGSPVPPPAPGTGAVTLPESPPSTDPPAPEPAAGPEPSAAPPAAEQPATAEQPPPGGPAAAAEQPASADAPAEGPSAGPGAPPGLGGGMPLERPRELAAEPARGALARAATRVIEILQNTALVAGQAAASGARAAGMPVGLVSMVALFLAAQDRIDRSDPRLRLSPLHAPAVLEFDPADPA